MSERTSVSELAKILAERRSAASAYVNLKGSAAGMAQPDVNITPDTTEEDVDRMTRLALRAFSELMSANAVKDDTEEKLRASVRAINKERAIRRNQAKKP